MTMMMNTVCRSALLRASRLMLEVRGKLSLLLRTSEHQNIGTSKVQLEDFHQNLGKMMNDVQSFGSAVKL